MKGEYMIVLAAMLAVPFIVSFDRRIGLYRSLKALGIAVTLPSLVFLVWDAVATERGHWSFNSSYVLGITLFGLPLEEYLFFLILGFVSVFTFEAMRAVRARRRG